MRIIFIFYVLCCSLTALPYSSISQSPEIRILKELNQYPHSQLDPSMKFFSNSEKMVGIGIPLSVCALGLLKKDSLLFKKGVNMTAGLLFNTISTLVIKHAINRDRPSVKHSFINAYEMDQHLSFPSGHTSNAFCNATALSLNFKKWYIVVPAYSWASVVAYSRMHLGMHYPSDVLGGVMLGMVSAWSTYKLNAWLNHFYSKKIFMKPHG